MILKKLVEFRANEMSNPWHQLYLKDKKNFKLKEETS